MLFWFETQGVLQGLDFKKDISLGSKRSYFTLQISAFYLLINRVFHIFTSSFQMDGPCSTCHATGNWKTSREAEELYLMCFFGDCRFLSHFIQLVLKICTADEETTLLSGDVFPSKVNEQKCETSCRYYFGCCVWMCWTLKDSRWQQKDWKTALHFLSVLSAVSISVASDWFYLIDFKHCS